MKALSSQTIQSQTVYKIFYFSNRISRMVRKTLDPQTLYWIYDVYNYLVFSAQYLVGCTGSNAKIWAECSAIQSLFDLSSMVIILLGRTRGSVQNRRRDRKPVQWKTTEHLDPTGPINPTVVSLVQCNGPLWSHDV